MEKPRLKTVSQTHGPCVLVFSVDYTPVVSNTKGETLVINTNGGLEEMSATIIRIRSVHGFQLFSIVCQQTGLHVNEGAESFVQQAVTHLGIDRNK